MTKNAQTKTAKKDHGDVHPVFVFGLDPKGKPIGARFPQGLLDNVVKAATDQGCSFVRRHSEEFTELGMKLPVGRIYSSGKAFIPNIRRDLFDRLKATQAKPMTPDDPEAYSSVGHTVADGPAAPEAAATKYSGLPRNWDDVQIGHMVLAHESPEDGWFEALVIEREFEVLTLRFRDYPKLPTFVRHLSTVALVNPGPA